jgi:hypothetical protein
VKYITVNLTEAELRATRRALGNMVDAATLDEQREFFGSAAGANAAKRALGILIAALREVKR